MRLRRLVCLATLVAFLPLATGCSRRETINLADDPLVDRKQARFEAGESIAISGYSTRDRGFVEWSGRVSLAGPDSLAFVKIEDRGTREVRIAQSFTLARGEVLALETIEYDAAAGVGVVALVVVSAGVVLSIAAIRALGDEDRWFPDHR